MRVRRRTALWTLAPALFVVVACFGRYSSHAVDGFVLHHQAAVESRCCRRTTPPAGSLVCNSNSRRREDKDSTDLDDNDDSDDNLFRGPESSLLSGFIRQYLDGSSSDFSGTDTTISNTTTPATASHLIAIPVDACHELTLELESIQRAILYHCPMLVHACLAPAVTRLPLLYVQASTSLITTAESSMLLQQLVQQTLQEFLTNDDNDREQQSSSKIDDKNAEYKTANESSSHKDAMTISDKFPNDNNNNNHDDDDFTTANTDGIQPWLVPFQGLGIDGPNNQVLYTTAVPTAYGTRRLEAFVQALRQRIQERTGWSTALPHVVCNPKKKNGRTGVDVDNDKVSSSSWSTTTSEFRIPFMRLPPDWEDIVRREHHRRSRAGDESSSSADQEEDDDDFMMMLPSDQGGNGISPIFWGQWMDDPFGKGDTTRLREVAIYRRRSSASSEKKDHPEQAFYLPERSVPLPVGNAALSKLEAGFRNYQEQRMLQAEAALESEKAGREDAVPRRQGEEDEDLLLAKTRERLEVLYAQPEGELEAKISANDNDDHGEKINKESADDEEEKDDEVDLKFSDRVGRPEDPKALDDWTRQRIQKAVASRARVQSQKELARKKDKLPIAENPIFQKYKDGTLVPPEQANLSVPTKELPPFPSREHCAGFWRVMSSPTGFDVEEDPSRSDNLVLRVDGTTAGGPILDRETRQKASGGTWRMIGDAPENARLRIRLVIPPKKERILVLEGRLEKVSMSTDLPLASSTFQIPALEKLAAKGAAKLEDIVYCGGDVWIEDTVTGRNREEIGTFSLVKLNVPSDPSQFTVTVPRPIRNQD